MRRNPSTIAVAVAAVVVFADLGFGHEWFFRNRNRDPIDLLQRPPTMEEQTAGVTAVYGVTVKVGKKQTVFIHDGSGCVARIPIESAEGGSAIAKANQSQTAFVQTQEIEIRGVAPGETVLTIPVTGDVSKNCTEATKNLLVVRVVADGAAAERQFEGEWRRVQKGLHGVLRTAGRTARNELLGTGKQVAAGTVDPEAGMHEIYTTAHAAIVGMRQSAWNDLGEFRTFVRNGLSSGGFAADETPAGTQLGTGGSWDLAVKGARFEYGLGLSYVDAGLGKLRTTLDKDYAKDPAAGLQFFYVLPENAFPEMHAPVAGTPGVDPRPKLGIDLVSGYSIDTPWGIEGYAFAGGFFDVQRGTPELKVTVPGGSPISVPLTISTVNGTWEAMVDDLAPGIAYSLDLSYGGGADRCVQPFSIPNLDLRF